MDPAVGPRSHRARSVAALSVSLAVGCDAAPNGEQELPITTLLLLDDGTVIEEVLYTRTQLEAMTMEALEELAETFRIETAGKTKTELIETILEAQSPRRNIGKDGNRVV